jgi:nucleoid-associated protein YgaU
MVAVFSWLVGLCAVAAVLVVAGRGALAGPDLTDPSSWSGWAGGREPVDAAVAVLRSGLLVVTLYLLAVTVLALVARAVALPRLVAGLDVAGGPLVRRVLTGAAGAGLAFSTLTPAVAMAQTSTPPPTAIMRLLDEPAPAPAPAPTTTIAPPVTDAPTPAPADEIVVAPGDSFWSLAERHVTERLQRTPSEHEVATYWRKLIAANTERLAVAGNPDLIYPGQTFRLPAE